MFDYILSIPKQMNLIFPFKLNQKYIHKTKQKPIFQMNIEKKTDKYLTK